MNRIPLYCYTCEIDLSSYNINLEDDGDLKIGYETNSDDRNKTDIIFHCPVCDDDVYIETVNESIESLFYDRYS